MSWGQPLAFTQQLQKYCLEERIRLAFINSGQRRLGNLAHPQVVEVAALRVHVRLNIPKTLASTQLSHEKAQELAPATHSSQPLPHMVLFGQGLELMSRQDSKELGENCVSMSQGLIPPVFTVFVGTTIVSTCWKLSLFYFPIFLPYGTAVPPSPFFQPVFRWRAAVPVAS